MYFFNKTKNEYFELIFPVSSNEDYINSLDTDDEIIATPQRPDCYHEWVDGAWVENTTEKTAQKTIEERGERDKRLSLHVDPVVSNPFMWATLSAEKQGEWTQYRTDLLNVPQQSGFPSSISWPSKPD